jgi:nucleoside-diphosphate-sugar epimerase
MKKIVIFRQHNLSSFCSFLKECLETKHHSVSIIESLNTFDENNDILIYFNYTYKENLEDIMKIVSSKIKKIIFIENASDIYLNSNNKLPYSTFVKLKPKNKLCKKIVEAENIICKNEVNVVLRVSEIYGPHINFGYIWDLIHLSNKVNLSKDYRDFLYEGDLIHAIEVSIESDANGVYNIASGQKTKINNYLIDLVNSNKKHAIIPKWKQANLRLSYNCENFKFFKWNPIVTIELGLKTTQKHKEKK